MYFYHPIQTILLPDWYVLTSHTNDPERVGVGRGSKHESGCCRVPLGGDEAPRLRAHPGRVLAAQVDLVSGEVHVFGRALSVAPVKLDGAIRRKSFLVDWKRAMVGWEI